MQGKKFIIGVGAERFNSIYTSIFTMKMRTPKRKNIFLLIVINILYVKQNKKIKIYVIS